MSYGQAKKGHIQYCRALCDLHEDREVFGACVGPIRLFKRPDNGLTFHLCNDHQIFMGLKVEEMTCCESDNEDCEFR